MLSPLSRKTVFRVIAVLAASISFAAAATFGVAALSLGSVEPGYLLYPQLGLCGPRSATRAEIAALKASHRRNAAFRPIRTADALMPPGLGQRLNARLIESGSATSVPSISKRVGENKQASAAEK